jgi:TIR domain
LDQWLRDKGIRVIRDESSFQAGTTIPDSIRRAVAEADKVVVIFSGHSRNRDWPRLERAIAEEVEARIGVPILIYVCLDDSPLPKHDDKRIAIKAKKQPLKVVGEKILHALMGSGLPLKRYEYDENQPL